MPVQKKAGNLLNAPHILNTKNLHSYIVTGSNGNQGVFHILQSSSITGTSPHIQDTDWGGSLIPLQRCSQCILQLQSTGQLAFCYLVYN